MFVSIFEHLAEDLLADKDQKEQGSKPLFPTSYRVLPYEITDVKVMVEPETAKAYLVLNVVSSKTKHSKKPLKIQISELSDMSEAIKKVKKH